MNIHDYAVCKSGYIAPRVCIYVAVHQKVKEFDIHSFPFVKHTCWHGIFILEIHDFRYKTLRDC